MAYTFHQLQLISKVDRMFMRKKEQAPMQHQLPSLRKSTLFLKQENQTLQFFQSLVDFSPWLDLQDLLNAKTANLKEGHRGRSKKLPLL